MPRNGSKRRRLFILMLILQVTRGSCNGHYELQNSHWSRSSGDVTPFSQRTSHIGPVPHINDVMTEWANWGSWEKCSRSCGGGVRSRGRGCIATYPRVMPGSGIRTSHNRCAGESVQYEVCGTDQCPAGQVSGISFRAAQCRHHNNRKVLGRLINSWVPYTQGGINPCALVCEGEGEGVVYTFGKVTDGTNCKTGEGSRGLCVNGRCLRLSCDGRLGGAAFEDMCRVCGGRNESCIRHAGVFHSERPSADQPISDAGRQDDNHKRTRSFGYYEVTDIPSGSTNVKVLDNSSNFLALKSGDKYLLNGDWLIDWPGEIDAAGTSFTYSRKEDQSEALTSLGPTNSDLALMVLLREDNPGIYYEYWIPNKKLKDSLTFRPVACNSSRLLAVAPDTAVTLKQTTTPATSPFTTTHVSSSTTLKIRKEMSKLKPAVLTSETLNKTFLHHRLDKQDLGLKGKENFSQPSSLFSKAKNKSDPSNSVYNKKSTPSKLPLPESNSVYDILYPTKPKLLNENDYHIKPFNEEYLNRKPYYEKKKKKGKKKKKKKKKKEKKKKKKERPAHCKPCLARRKAKHSFCISDFVCRVQVLSEDSVGFRFRRLEALVLQSYKNKVPLLYKEFLWQHECACKRLRTGVSYIVMGTTEKSRGNEVKLVLGEESFVRRFSRKVLTRIIKIRQNEMRYCRPWRLHLRQDENYSFGTFVTSILKKNTEPQRTT